MKLHLTPNHFCEEFKIMFSTVFILDKNAITLKYCWHALVFVYFNLSLIITFINSHK